MSADSISLTQKPAAVSRSADWMVLALLILGLVGGFLLRQNLLFSLRDTTVDGVTIALPTNSVRVSATPFEATTPDGLTVRIERMAAPTIDQTTLPTVGEDLSPAPQEEAGTTANALTAIMTNRAISQGRNLPMYRAVSTDTTTAANRLAGVMEYAYVNDQNSFFSSGMEIVHGQELLIVEGDQLYVVSLEGPDGEEEAFEAYWPHLVSSLRLEAAPTGGQ